MEYIIGFKEKIVDLGSIFSLTTYIEYNKSIFSVIQEGMEINKVVHQPTLYDDLFHVIDFYAYDIQPISIKNTRGDKNFMRFSIRLSNLNRVRYGD